jgi:DNA replication licensing factor MCM6
LLLQSLWNLRFASSWSSKIELCFSSTYHDGLSLQLSSEAKKVLVESYVALRRGDSTPGTRVAYRMTVRQLEALIRLSEAIARSHLERIVSNLHAYVCSRLLNYL